MNHNPRILINILMLVVLALSGMLPAAAKPPIDAVDPTSSSSLLFIENAGQFAEGARYQVLGASQGTVWLAQEAIWLTIVEPAAEAPARSPFTQESGEPDVGGVPHHGVAIKLSFVGANPQPRLEPFSRLDTHVSYFLGSDPAGWRANVPVWGGVRYVELYPGIDLELAGEPSGMVPRLVTRPGADLSAVRLRVEGVDGAAVENGVLRLSSPAGEVSWPLLQEEGMTDEALVQPNGTGSFEIISPLHAPITQVVAAPADDPSDLLYSTFLGSSEEEWSHGIAVDGSGAAYITGVTQSTDFPTTPGAFDTSYNGSYGDVFVAKLNPAGSSLEYATFLGGSENEGADAIVVDVSGAAYVTGYTYSSNFPTTPGAFDATFNSRDAFVAKLNATGSALTYGTYLGGSSYEWGVSIDVDGIGAAFVMGYTDSSDFPTMLGAFDTSYNGDDDTFVAKLNTAGSALDYSTFLGGGGGDYPKSIDVDGAGAAYISGHSYSSDFPTTPGSFDTSHNGGYYDAFVVKLNAAGSALDYSTFLGGSSGESGHAIAVDGSGAAYLTGLTESADFPITEGAFDTSYNGGWYDAFVAKLNSAGSALDYATFLCGSGGDVGYDIAVGADGTVLITGLTDSSDFCTTSDAFDTSFNGGFSDAFVVKLDTASSFLYYATFFGGSAGDDGFAVALDGSGAAYLSGGTRSSDFPTTPGALDTSLNGNSDIYLLKLTMAEDGIIYVDVDATGANNGTSWADAFTALQPALDAATSGDQIWVAAGTYKPSIAYGGTGDRYKSFQLKNGVAIYGGFAGVESSLEERDWATNLTILGGDLGTVGYPEDNSYHVFYHPLELALDSSAILDGFTITGGHANSSSPHLYGGGMLNIGASPTLSNLTFTGNWAYDGGGLYNWNGSAVTLTSCTFVGNVAEWAGGGMYTHSSAPVLTDCIFMNNSADQGGGISNVYYSSPAVTNTTFWGNTADYGGGVYNIDNISLVMTNCTFAGNSGIYGGVMYSYIAVSAALTNAILWGNTPDQVAGDAITLTYSTVQGGYSGTGNIVYDPHFTDPANGDFHLGLGSPAIDAGSNAALYLPLLDFEGNERILDGNGDGDFIVDMGVDEAITGGLIPMEVEIDIKPSTPQNSFRFGKGTLPVAILTTVDFDAATVDPSTVLFANALAESWELKDADRDGDVDLLLYFMIAKLSIDFNTTEITLTATTFDGLPIYGTDTVNIIFH